MLKITTFMRIDHQYQKWEEKKPHRRLSDPGFRLLTQNFELSLSEDHVLCPEDPGAELVVCLQEGSDLLAGMDDGGMVPSAHGKADLRQGYVRFLAHQVHDHLTGQRHVFCTVAAHDLFNGNAEDV